MYLKSIAAKGFKSFAEQTLIELDNNLTGIVGPNGSGKSNVVDAIRWVLGEQSVKSLRGDGAMTDVIFSGSKTRNKASSATVTLALNNEDQHLNIPYTEVTIKRQLFDSGESDYYLNGNKCRLKDITDLLIDSGIGRESFNIIGQGAIDSIINTKAEDRRVIIEDAAGVLKYKKRKEKALNQLAKTHDNLNRVNDIIINLEDNLIPLKEQAEIATNYNELKHQLTYLEIALTAHDIKVMDQEYQQTKKQVTELSSTISQIDTSFLTEETDLLNYKNQLALLNEKWHQLNQELIIKTTALEKIKAEKQLVIERTKYQKQDQNLDQAIALKEAVLKQTNSLNHLQLDLKNLLNELTVNQQNLHQIEKQLSVINQDVLDQNHQITATENKLYTLKQKHWQLENTINDGHHLPSSIKAILNNKNLTGIHHCTGKLINAEAKYAEVINISLGAASQFMIVDHESDAKRAINFLSINELGRATFLPLSTTKPRLIEKEVIADLINEHGFIDIALNLVSFEPKYYPVYANLLGNTIVTKDIDSAINISQKLNKRYRVVTINGDLVNVGGSLTGGKYKTTNGIINDTFELQKLSDEINNLTNHLQQLQVPFNEKKDQQQALKLQFEQLTEAKLKIEHFINLKQSLISEQTEKIDQTQNELNTYHAIIDDQVFKLEDDLIKQYYAIEAEVNYLKQQLSDISRESGSLTSTINELEHKIKTQNTNFNYYQNQLKEAEINANRLEVKLDYALNYLNEEYSITFEKALANYHLEIDINDARIKVNKLKYQIKKLGEVNLGAIEEYERINQKYTFLNNQREDLLKAETTILTIINDMDQVMTTNFQNTFNAINREFKQVFSAMFGGGSAELVLTDENNLLTSGIEIKALPPGKKLMHISLLSGGEKTLTAISLLFAILNSKPVPFCILDEVEAALDEANVIRFCEYLSKYKDKTQFLIITHQKKTMEYVNNLYGITMQEAGISKLVSVKLSD